MRKLSVSYGNSRNSTKWSNKETTFDDLCGRVSATKRTTETVAEYQRMSKTRKGEVKDVGGFTCCHLRGGRRKRENVVAVSMIKLDGDAVTTDFLDRFEMLNTYECCVYSTHSHTPDSPRLRIIIPAKRDMSPDEANAVGRFIAAELGIDQFDPCSYIPHQLMYWPSTPSDGEFVYKRFNGDWLDPDAVLALHPDWRDCTLLPTSSKESAATVPSKTKIQDPLTKSGLVGAFCRAYSIEDTIENFLSDVYSATNDSHRYTYAQGESVGGLVVYDDGRFAYSHHATDPICGKECNAFDLVRLHNYGGLDDKKSFQAMSEFALTLDKVKIQLAEDRQAGACEDFTAPLDETDPSRAGNTGDWRTKLTYMPKSSQLDNTVWNLMLIFNNDPDCRNFAFNEMANRVQVTGVVPWERPSDNKFWREADTAQLKALIDVRYTAFSTRNHDVCFAKVTDDRRFHPVRNYLDGLPEWDGVPRVDTQLVRYMQADDTPYVRAVTRKTHVAAVARIYRPGIKFDCMLVLDGVQGIGKSSYFKALVGEDYYCETLSLADMADKSGAEKIQDNWAVEISELAGIKKTDVEVVKSFLSTSDDKYRPSYGRVVESHPRQCIIVGSVNGERGYLRDITGNRRFWIVKLRQEEQVKKWTLSSEERDQIWAEAKFYYEQGEPLYLDDSLVTEAQDAQREAMEQDERQGAVEEYLEMLLPTTWDTMSGYDRRNYFFDRREKDRIDAIGVNRREYVSNAEIWCECFGRSLADMKPADSYALAALMTKVNGWVRTKERRQTGLYGRQQVYLRTGNPSRAGGQQTDE